MDFIEKLEHIADHYGYETQSRQTQEECAELTQAINKLARSKEEGRKEEEKALKAVIEEIADVKIMVNQLAYLLHVEADVAVEAEKKIERQTARIREKYKTHKYVRKVKREKDGRLSIEAEYYTQKGKAHRNG